MHDIICFQEEIEQMGILSKDFWPLLKIEHMYRQEKGMMHIHLKCRIFLSNYNIQNLLFKNGHPYSHYNVDDWSFQSFHTRFCPTHL